MMKIVYFFLICSLSTSCIKKRLGRESLVTTSDGYGNIESKIHYIDDSVKNGIAEYFYKNGRLKDQIMYRNNAKDGFHIHYYPNGQIQFKKFFKTGVQQGKTYWYYSDGKLEQESNWRNGTPFGSAFYYYSNGNFQAYRCFDFQGNMRYVFEKDSVGTTILDEGMIIGQLFLNENYDSISVNQQIKADVCVATPPNKLVKVMVYEYNEKGNVISEYEGAIEDNLMQFSTSFKNAGRYKVVIKAIMRSQSDASSKMDSIVARFNVNKN